jgi:hypothetical protein
METPSSPRERIECFAMSGSNLDSFRPAETVISRVDSVSRCCAVHSFPSKSSTHLHYQWRSLLPALLRHLRPSPSRSVFMKLIRWRELRPILFAPLCRDAMPCHAELDLIIRLSKQAFQATISLRPVDIIISVSFVSGLTMETNGFISIRLTPDAPLIE